MTDTVHPLVVFTIGHSNHSIADFISLLHQAGINAIADVRSVPFSRFAPQFNRPALKEALKAAGVSYSFLGEELGARSKDPACYLNGTATYELIAASPFFQAGLVRVMKGAQRYAIALMCAEKDPLDCHRNILVARNLAKRGVIIRHVMPDGRIEQNEITEKRLLKLTGEETRDMFVAPTSGDPLERAYKKRGSEIAYTETAEERNGSATT